MGHAGLMKAHLFLLSILAVVLFVYPFPNSVAQSAKAPSPALLKVAEQLRTMLADHPKRAAIGVASAEIPEKLARLANRARYLCGEIQKDEFLRRSDEITATWSGIFAEQQKTGRADPDQFLSFAESAIADWSLP
jgi:hypothetical protein